MRYDNFKVLALDVITTAREIGLDERLERVARRVLAKEGVKPSRGKRKNDDNQKNENGQSDDAAVSDPCFEIEVSAFVMNELTQIALKAWQPRDNSNYAKMPLEEAMLREVPEFALRHRPRRDEAKRLTLELDGLPVRHDSVLPIVDELRAKAREAGLSDKQRDALNEQLSTCGGAVSEISREALGEHNANEEDTKPGTQRKRVHDAKNKLRSVWSRIASSIMSIVFVAGLANDGKAMVREMAASDSAVPSVRKIVHDSAALRVREMAVRDLPALRVREMAVRGNTVFRVREMAPSDDSLVAGARHALRANTFARVREMRHSPIKLLRVREMRSQSFEAFVSAM